ncbi:MAG: hypothetical protein AB1861_22085 [Cyanobacteriota bacterium]
MTQIVLVLRLGSPSLVIQITRDATKNHFLISHPITNDNRKFTDIIDIEFKSQTMPSIQLLPTALSELFAQVSYSGSLTLADRYGLMAALLDDSLGQEERDVIDRLLRAACKGRLSLVEQISAVM